VPLLLGALKIIFWEFKPVAGLLDLRDLSIELPITSEMRSRTADPARWGAMVVEAYLEMQGIGIDRGACYWRNLLEKDPIADVVLTGLGRLECLVLKDWGQERVPIDDSYDRLGYVVVIADDSAVTIAGFATEIEDGCLVMDEVMSIDDWMVWLGQMELGIGAIGEMSEVPEWWSDSAKRAGLVAQLNRLYRRAEPWEWRYEGEKVLREERELEGASREDGMNESRIDFQDLAEAVMERLASIWNDFDL
jgi:hypothetical protein